MAKWALKTQKIINPFFEEEEDNKEGMTKTIQVKFLYLRGL